MPRFISNACMSGLFVLLAAVGLAMASTPAAVQVLVVDQNGKPLPDAVITLVAKNGTATTARPATRVTVDQRNRAFAPFVSAVPRGAEVEFSNSDGFGHHVYSFSKAKRFELKMPSRSRGGPVTFDTAGIVSLGCNIHDDMLAYVLVTDTPYFDITGTDGGTTFEGVAAGEYIVNVWHPRLKSRRRMPTQAVSPAPGATLSVKLTATLKKANRSRKRRDRERSNYQ